MFKSLPKFLGSALYQVGQRNVNYEMGKNTSLKSFTHPGMPYTFLVSILHLCAGIIETASEWVGCESLLALHIICNCPTEYCQTYLQTSPASTQYRLTRVAFGDGELPMVSGLDLNGGRELAILLDRRPCRLWCRLQVEAVQLTDTCPGVVCYDNPTDSIVIQC